MIYTRLDTSEELSQGDILDDCPVLIWQPPLDESAASAVIRTRVIVLTQACDVAQTKTDRIVIAVVHDAKLLVESGKLNSKTIRDQIRAHRVYGWYFLPAGPGLEESIVDLRDLHTIPHEMLSQLITDGKRVCRLVTPYREHMAQHFSTTYSRIGLPQPYGTEA